LAEVEIVTVGGVPVQKDGSSIGVVKKEEDE
jgi:hypothetical protein